MLLVILVVLLCLGLVQAQGLLINTPVAAVTCLPLLITFTGSNPPYFVTVLPGSLQTAPPLVSFPPTSSTSLTWIVNVPAGTYNLALRDSTGATALTAPFPVTAGPDTSCLTAASSPISSASSAIATLPSNATSSSASTSNFTSSRVTGLGTQSSDLATSATSPSSQTSSPPFPTGGANGKSTSTSIIIGAAVGSIVGAAAIVGLLFLLIRRRRKRAANGGAEPSAPPILGDKIDSPRNARNELPSHNLPTSPVVQDLELNQGYQVTPFIPEPAADTKDLSVLRSDSSRPISQTLAGGPINPQTRYSIPMEAFTRLNPRQLQTLQELAIQGVPDDIVEAVVRSMVADLPSQTTPSSPQPASRQDAMTPAPAYDFKGV